MGENVNPFSFKRDIFGQVKEPKYIVDKILSYTFYYVECPKCGFYNNTGKTYENCPECGENFILMKEGNYEEPN